MDSSRHSLSCGCRLCTPPRRPARTAGHLLILAMMIPVMTLLAIWTLVTVLTGSKSR